MNNSTNIEQVVMRRVYRIRALRFVFSNFTVACLLLAIALYGIGREVWVAMILRNMPHSSLLAVGNFYLAAFQHTHLIVQALTLLVFASAIYLARETARLLTTTLSLSRV